MMLDFHQPFCFLFGPEVITGVRPGVIKGSRWQEVVRARRGWHRKGAAAHFSASSHAAVPTGKCGEKYGIWFNLGDQAPEESASTFVELELPCQSRIYFFESDFLDL